jgi:hypothetical protein
MLSFILEMDENVLAALILVIGECVISQNLQFFKLVRKKSLKRLLHYHRSKYS